jgi:hypothetical protein
MRSRAAYCLVLFAAVIVLAVFLLVRSPFFQIGYHNRQMQHAWKASMVDLDGGPIFDDSHARSRELYEYHRQRLIELGAACELHYTMRHLQSPTEESQHFLRSLYPPTAPELIDFSSPHPPTVEPMKLTIWCFIEHADACDRFVAERDLPDYRSRFMED